LTHPIVPCRIYWRNFQYKSTRIEPNRE
jgi:hypothetical protein